MSLQLSVVVANATSDPAEVASTLAALRRELERGDQVVWVDRADASPLTELGAARVETVRAACDAGRGDLYGLGLRRVDCAVVAFTDSTTVPAVGWRYAVMRAFDSGAVTVAGGPVRPAGDLDPVTRARFLVEYGPHATPPFLSASGDLSANNIVYRTDALRSVVPDDVVWKTVVNQRLRSSGIELVVLPDMGVEVTTHDGARSLVVDRVNAGRLYGSQAAVDATIVSRMVRAVACLVLPMVLSARTIRAARRDQVLRKGLCSAAPVIVLAALAWSAGEALGRVTGRPPREGVM